MKLMRVLASVAPRSSGLQYTVRQTHVKWRRNLVGKSQQRDDAILAAPDSGRTPENRDRGQGMCLAACLISAFVGQKKSSLQLSRLAVDSILRPSSSLIHRDCASMAARPAGGRQLQTSERIQKTDVPVMVTNMRLLGGQTDVASLSQGAVYWLPPESAIRKASAEATEAAVSGYNSDWGIPELREALEHKIRDKNDLQGYRIMVTAGANQALASLMLTLMDPHDRSVMFKPYYFNALMAIQMTGGSDTLTLGPSDPDTLHPDLDWLQKALEGPQPPKLVYLVTPANPTGVTLPREKLERLADMTEAAGCWLVVDNTYEHFLFSGAEHATIGRPNTIHVFSFSKGYGLHGWRVGYMAYPDHDGKDSLGIQLAKVQDTVVIHAAVLSQKLALEALRHGPPDTIERLKSNRQAVLDALKPLGTLGNGLHGGDAIYVFARLPPDCQDDVAVNRWLVHVHKVAVIPGTGCGFPGHIRVAFGKPEPKAFLQAADRLGKGIQQLCEQGFEASVGQWIKHNPSLQPAV